MMPVFADFLNDITFTIEGNVYASQDYQSWNFTNKQYRDFWNIQDSQNIRFQGSGVVDGQGYWWWMREYLILNKGRRPRLVNMYRVRNCHFEGVKW